MHKRPKGRVWLLAVLAMLLLGIAGTTASASTSSTSTTSTTINGVTCNTTAFNPVKFAIVPNQSYTCTISDPNLVVNGPVNVYIQGDFPGSPQVIPGTGDTSAHTITFTFKATFRGCGTTALTYDASADNKNGNIVNTNTGFGFVDSSGNEIMCGTPGSITVIKHLSPTDDPGLFNLMVNTTVVKADASNGGSGTASNLSSDTYTVSEAAGTSTTVANYDSTYSCTNGASGTGTTTQVDLGVGQNVTCTFTNTRKPPPPPLKGSITLIKHLSPTDDHGLFNLVVGEHTVAANVGNNGSGTASDLVAGSYMVSETAGTDTSLDNYTSSVSCTNDATGTTSTTVVLAAGQNVTCTFTNTRKPPPTGSITVIKHLMPTDDPGLFNLNVGEHTVAANVGNNGSGTASDLVAGNYTVSESAGTNTSLDNYTSSVSCTNDATGTTTTSFALAAGQNVTCTFTNTRKPAPTGSITVIKHLMPTDDSGVFTLKIGDTAVATNVGNNGTGEATGLTAGSYMVSEVAGTSTDLANYDSTVTCTNDATGTTSTTVVLAAGQNVTCTFTNTRKPVTPPPVRHIYVIKEVKDASGNLIPVTPTGFFQFTLTCTGGTAQTTVLYMGGSQLVGTCAMGVGGSVSEPPIQGNWQNDAAATQTFVAGDGDVVLVFINKEMATPSTPGATGPQGPAGPTGPQGPAGTAGANGSNGSNGSAGPQGPAGPAGTPGAAGPAGPQGPAGPAGKAGKNGKTTVVVRCMVRGSNGKWHQVSCKALKSKHKVKAVKVKPRKTTSVHKKG